MKPHFTDRVIDVIEWLAATFVGIVAANAGAAFTNVVARLASNMGVVLAACIVAPSGGAFVRTACPAAVSDRDANGIDIVLTFGGGADLLLDSFALV